MVESGIALGPLINNCGSRSIPWLCGENQDNILLVSTNSGLGNIYPGILMYEPKRVVGDTPGKSTLVNPRRARNGEIIFILRYATGANF